MSLHHYWWTCAGFPGSCGDRMARSPHRWTVETDRDAHMAARHPLLVLTEDQERLQEWPHSEP